MEIINSKRISFETTSLGEHWIRQFRPPLFWDMDLYKFFETVFQKSSFLVEENASYHITDEYENDPESEYSIQKKEYGYYSSWKEHEMNSDYYHNKFYDDGELKYHIVK